MFRETPHGSTKLKTQSIEIQPDSALLGNNVDISSYEQILVVPEKLPNQSFEMISHDGIPHLAADGNTNTRTGIGSFFPENDEAV